MLGINKGDPARGIPVSFSETMGSPAKAKVKSKKKKNSSSRSPQNKDGKNENKINGTLKGNYSKGGS